MKILIGVVAFLMWSSQAIAFEKAASPLEKLFDAPSLELGIPKPLALAIAEVESGLHPWTLNIEGRGYRFDSKAEALAKAEEAGRAGRSFDVGLMQVNNWWLKKFDVPLEAAFDPWANVYFGGWILKEELKRHGGDVAAAAGAYHSPNPERAGRYAKQVMAALEKGPQKRVVAPKGKTVQLASAGAQTKVSRVAPASPAAEIKFDEIKAAPMLVASRGKGLAQAHNMKVAPTAAGHSMKVKA